MADEADVIGGLMYALAELCAPERWLSGSGPSGGLRLRLRASGEEGDGVNITLGKVSVLVSILVLQHYTYWLLLSRTLRGIKIR